MISHNKFFSVLFLLASAFFYSCNDEEVTPTLENKLVAVAGSDLTANRNEEVSLDASASKDGNNRPFTILWSVKTKPQGSNASFSKPDTVKTTFTPDVAGLYVVRLTIRQGSWTSFDDVVITVTDPQSEGPQTVVINEDVTANTTLVDIFEDPSQVDYLVTEDINVRASLIVMPGVLIAFAEDKGMQITTGSVSAIGTAQKKIIFRGADNGAAFWKGIVIHTNSESNEFEHARIEQGGSSAHPETGVKANLAIAGTTYSGGAVKVSETSFATSGGYGFYLQGMSSLSRFTSNSFSDNAQAAYIAANQLHQIDANTLTDNSGLFKIETGGPVLNAGQVVWKRIDNGSYIVTSHISISTGVIIEPGASFKMETGMTINVTDNGYLKATGLADARIVFTSSATNAYWNGIYFDTYNENNQIEYCEVSNAGLNTIAGSEHPGNIVLGHAGIVTIENSIIRKGLGYGVVAKVSNQVNENLATANTFADLGKGVMFPEAQQSPEKPPLTGLWFDQWSFQQNLSALQDSYYNRDTQTWFGGAANPWAPEIGKGMGIRIDEDMNFSWLIAEHSPMTGCESYSAEYITGAVTVNEDQITFNQDYWRSKFINSCDPTQNVDMDVAPSAIALRYEIVQLSNLWTGEIFWELKFFNPDGSSFSYYRR